MTGVLHSEFLDKQSARADRRSWQLHRGANVTPHGVMFSVWAPTAKTVDVQIANGTRAGSYPMVKASDKRGVWELHVEGAAAGDRYGYSLDGAEPLPDPASRFQPDGVHALSQVVDPTRFAWTDISWTGLSLADFVIYELHIGTFTPEGTFDAAIARLSDLAALGITAVEVMPLASFPGKRNWGYDGVLFYAPQATYGDADAFRRFVDAAHGLKMAVVLDVVYNHVGPEGNYLDRYGPYHTDAYHTPWGRALNYDGPGSDSVRRWAHDNALYWISEYHVDALRLDAVQGIYDFGAVSFLEELSDDVHALGRQEGRKIQLMAESDLNDPRLVTAPKEGGFGLDAQWADDVHHVIHTTLTGEGHGYYVDFKDIAFMPDVYREPFFYGRRYSRFRDRMHGRSPAHVPRQRFVIAAQNHDQVANRPDSDRFSALLPPERLRMSAALVLLSPYLPLLFMGEEYGDTAPFYFFADFSDPDLVANVRAGRAREHDVPHKKGPPPDPFSEEAFTRSHIDWSLRERGAHAQLLSLYTDLLALRREEPALRPGESTIQVHGSADWMTILRTLPLRSDWSDRDRARAALLCVFNTSDEPLDVPLREGAVAAWELRLTTDAVGYGGKGEIVNDIQDGDASVRLAPWTAAVYMSASDR